MSKDDHKRKRLAAALRENLKRRKARPAQASELPDRDGEREGDDDGG